MVGEVVGADEQAEDIVSAAGGGAGVVGYSCGGGGAGCLGLLFGGEFGAAVAYVAEGEVVEVLLDSFEVCVDVPGDAVDDPLGEDDWARSTIPFGPRMKLQKHTTQCKPC